jgi:hypothetical protein
LEPDQFAGKHQLLYFMTYQITQNNGRLHAPVFSFDPLPFFFDALPVILSVEKKRQGNEAVSPVQWKLLILLL